MLAFYDILIAWFILNSRLSHALLILNSLFIIYLFLWGMSRLTLPYLILNIWEIIYLFGWWMIFRYDIIWIIYGNTYRWFSLYRWVVIHYIDLFFYIIIIKWFTIFIFRKATWSYITHFYLYFIKICIICFRI